MNYLRKFLRSQRGDALIELLVLTPILVVLLAGPPLVWLFLHKLTMLEAVKNQYLHEAQYTGGFTAALWTEMTDKLNAEGFDPAQLRFDGSSPVGQFYPRGSELHLRIGYPQGNWGAFLTLLPMAAPDPTKMVWVEGSILSEKHP